MVYRLRADAIWDYHIQPVPGAHPSPSAALLACFVYFSLNHVLYPRTFRPIAYMLAKILGQNDFAGNRGLNPPPKEPQTRTRYGVMYQLLRGFCDVSAHDRRDMVFCQVKTTHDLPKTRMLLVGRLIKPLVVGHLVSGVDEAAKLLSACSWPSWCGSWRCWASAGLLVTRCFRRASQLRVLRTSFRWYSGVKLLGELALSIGSLLGD